MENNLPVYQNGITLSPDEERLLVEKAWDQSRVIAKILMNRQPRGFTTQEMFECLKALHGKNVNEHSVKRAMSTMTGTKNAPKKYQDQHGRWPLVKLDEKRLNPVTGIEIHLYAWNARYKQPLSHQELSDRYKGQQQIDFHEEII